MVRHRSGPRFVRRGVEWEIDGAMEPTATFEEARPRLFGVAYRMLGSVADAEDVVQEAFLRWLSARPEDVREPAAWLTTVVTRLCIDQLKSARARRERYVGPWLPEPLLGDTTVPDAGEAAPDTTEEEFRTFSKNWREEVGAESSLSKITGNMNYLRNISLGRKAVP